MDEAKKNLAERLKSANNVLVTVSRNPSVDQLSALLGLSLFLNKEGKHCAAVFSGVIPSTLEFLKPESTIQKNTDSLRDFIIALDKSKADKLRYKVEDNVVRIFITPYKSSIGQDDLDFSQGDFNVDVVVAIGVSDQSELDEAITAHGRILHDATVASINTGSNGKLGSINWNDPAASSLSELVTELTKAINAKSLDEQIATALLTGIVATTDRFSNDKTSAKTMSISSDLMAAGANQQLVANKLETQTDAPQVPEETTATDATPPESEVKAEPGTLEIEHEELSDAPSEKLDDKTEQIGNIELPEPEDDTNESEIKVPEELNEFTRPAGLSGGPKLVTEPPTLGGTLTANAQANGFEPTTDPLSMPKSESPTILDRNRIDTSDRAPFKPLDNLTPPTPASSSTGLPNLTPPPSNWSAPSPTFAVPEPPAPAEAEAAKDSADPLNGASTSLGQVQIDEEGEISQINSGGTLTELEEAVHSPHIQSGDPADAARSAVDEAFASGPNNSLPTPSPALNSQPLGPELHPSDATTPPPVPPPFNPSAS